MLNELMYPKRMPATEFNGESKKKMREQSLRAPLACQITCLTTRQPIRNERKELIVPDTTYLEPRTKAERPGTEPFEVPHCIAL